MAVSVTVLGSGSRGNSTVVASSRTRLLVDAGFSCREIFRRMKDVGLDPRQLDGVLITHEHSDHVSGLAVLARKLNVPVFMTGATCENWVASLPDAQSPDAVLKKRENFQAGRSFCVGDIEVRSFTIPHDAADPVGFTFRAEGVRVGVVTDLGYMAANVVEQIRGCDVLMIESNHDTEMLRLGPYPWAVKQRVMSRVGHLSNEALADFFASAYDGNATFVVLAHLSEQNNHPELARRAAEAALSPRRNLVHNRLLLASQKQALGTLTL